MTTAVEKATKPEVGTLEGESQRLRDATKSLVASLEGRRESFERALAGRVDPDLFIQIIANAYMSEPKLLKCSILSIYAAAIEAATVGLRPDGEEAAIIPYKDSSGDLQAQFVPMWQGYVRLMYRAGCKKVWAEVVRSGDDFQWWRGPDEGLRHVPAPSARRGEVTDAYAWAKLKSGEIVFEVMDLDELKKVQQAAAMPNSPAYRDWLDQMQRKAPLRRLRKFVDLDATAAAAFRVDSEFDAGRVVPLVDRLPEADRRSIAERAESVVEGQKKALAASVGAATEESSDPLDRRPEFGKPANEWRFSTWRETLADPRGFGYVKHYLLTRKKQEHPSLTDALKLRLQEEVARIDAENPQAAEVVDEKTGEVTTTSSEPSAEDVVGEASKKLLAKMKAMRKAGALYGGEESKIEIAIKGGDFDELLSWDETLSKRAKTHGVAL